MEIECREDREVKLDLANIRKKNGEKGAKKNYGK